MRVARRACSPGSDLHGAERCPLARSTTSAPAPWGAWFQFLPCCTPSVRRVRMLRSAILPGVFLALAGAAATAQTSFYFTVSMDGAHETPPNSSVAGGSGCLVLDTAAHTLAYSITFAGLSSAEQATDIHCCASPGTAGPVIFRLLDGPAIAGSRSVT